ETFPVEAEPTGREIAPPARLLPDAETLHADRRAETPPREVQAQRAEGEGLADEEAHQAATVLRSKPSSIRTRARFAFGRPSFSASSISFRCVSGDSGTLRETGFGGLAAFFGLLMECHGIPVFIDCQEEKRKIVRNSEIVLGGSRKGGQ